ncbi:MAG: ABC transporter substrate-binding protein [Nostocaceae cyanobacterium]|nr:ABC transporter substrate-binding protein [Nostocaceae cyanobacterium]
MSKSIRIRLLSTIISGSLAAICLMFIGSNASRDGCSSTPPDPALIAQGMMRISVGNKSLFTEISPEKQEALKLIEEKKYDEAIPKLEKFLQNNPKDPEALIFLNNARSSNEKLPSYTIAVAVPIERNPGAAEEILRGVALAQNEINNYIDSTAKPLSFNGVKLMVAIANDSSQQETTKNIALAIGNQDIEGKKLLGVVGHFTTDSTKNAGEIYQCAKEKLVAISPTSTSIKLVDNNPYIFTTSLSDQLEASALALHMTRLNKTKVAIFYNSNSRYSKSLKSQFQSAVESVGGEVIHDANEFDISYKQNNSEQRLYNAKNAEVLMFATTNDDIPSLMQIVEANKKKLMLLGGDSFDDPDIKNNLNVAAAEGMVLAVPWHQDMASATNFVKNSQKLWGLIDVNWRTAMAYDATEAFIEAFRQIKKEHPLREEVRSKLAEPDFSAKATAGTVQFERSQDRKAVFKLVKICRDPKSLQYDFVPVEKCER